MQNRNLIFILLFGASFLFNQLFAVETVKLTPQLRTITVSKEEERAKKLDVWRKKFVDIQILDETQVKDTPRVIADRTGKLMSVSGDEVYIDKLDFINYHTTMGIYRIDSPIKDKATKTLLGYSLNYLADARLLKYNVENDLSLIKLSSTGNEVLAGDRVLNKDKYDLNIKANKNQNLQGKVVFIIEGVKHAQTNKSVILNLGSQQIRAGDLLSVFKQTNVKRTVQLQEEKFYHRDHFLSSERNINAGKSVNLPCEPVATILVYKVFKNSSVALVIESKETVNLEQEVSGYAKL